MSTRRPVIREPGMSDDGNDIDALRELAAQRLRRIVTLGALAAALTHLLWPKLAIDAITVVLLLAAALPWLAPLFKSLQLPGGWKIEFQEIAARRLKVAAALGAASARRVEGTASTEIVAGDSREAADIAADAVTPRTVRTLRRRSILWVDDRPENNVFERQALEAVGFHFVLSQSTEDALAKLKAQSLDLVISDMSRPPDLRAGFTLLDAIRGTGNQVPFLIYAGRRSPEPAEATKMGALGTTNRPGELFEMVLKAFGISAPARFRTPY